MYAHFSEYDESTETYDVTLEETGEPITLKGFVLNKTAFTAYQDNQEFSASQNLRAKNITIALCVWASLSAQIAARVQQEAFPAANGIYAPNYSFFSNLFNNIVDYIVKPVIDIVVNKVVAPIAEVISEEIGALGIIGTICSGSFLGGVIVGVAVTVGVVLIAAAIDYFTSSNTESIDALDEKKR